MDKEYLTVPDLEVLTYRFFAQLPRDPPPEGPFLVTTLIYQFLAFLTVETSVAAFFIPLLLLTLAHLFCTSSRGIRAWHSRWPSLGPCRSLDTHRGPKSPARERSWQVLFLAVAVFLLGIDIMSTLNPNASPWRPEGSDAATGVSGAQQSYVLSTSKGAKLSGTADPLSTAMMYNHRPKRKHFFVLSRGLSSTA